MSSFFGQFSAFANSVAWLLALVFVVSKLHRAEGERFNNAFGMGFLFSLVVVVSMSDPIILPKGTGIYDMRYLLIGVSTGLFGPIAGAKTLITALGYRIWIGGPGVDAAILGA